MPGVTSIVDQLILSRSKTVKRGRFIVASVWLTFTVTLLVWWIYFGFHQVDRLSQLGYPDALELASFQRMLMWEGGTLIALIISGGMAGLYLLAKELRTQGEIRAFFAAFTHEMRTSLSALLIRIESLSRTGTQPEAAQSLLTEVERMRLQLDNALLATVSAEGGLSPEPLIVGDVLGRVAVRFSDLSIAAVGETQVRVACDARAFESMISNLLSNSLVHGQAGGVTITVSGAGSGKIELRFSDDGVGFRGQTKLLGQKFARHYEGSGTGLGLAITTDLARRSGGAFSGQVSAENRFVGVLALPEAR